MLGNSWIGWLTDLADPELCDQVKGSSNGQRNVQELGDLVSLLVTKNTGREQQPRRHQYSSKLLDFVAACVSHTATQLVKVFTHPLKPGKY